MISVSKPGVKYFCHQFVNQLIIFSILGSSD